MTIVTRNVDPPLPGWTSITRPNRRQSDGKWSLLSKDANIELWTFAIFDELEIAWDTPDFNATVSVWTKVA